MKLHAETVSAELFALLQNLMRDDRLEPFALAGGTALALRFGHRTSIDLDIFTCNTFDVQATAGLLKTEYGMKEAQTAQNTVRGIIAGIKIDLISHRYPLLKPFEKIRGIRMFSCEDIVAMKLNAIANRGCKKDFWDYAELLQIYSRDEMLSFFAKKYQSDSLWNVEKSLTYFDDAESDPDPRDLRSQSWEKIKQIVLASARL
ncbi:MAG: nucleotidyl transferase AbiEii/AbiGii toxin family protein [Verrucomicrobia bacterium]|nr:nucleotidyl transferase AbiEii/AbiGii toxin family protein [Verrucomicrobiota bacterium]